MMNILDTHLVTLGSVSITVGALVGCVILIFMTWLVAEGLSHAIERFFPRDRPRARSLFRRTVRIGAWTIGIFASLATLGFDIGAILATSAVVGVGIGLALQKILQSVLAGFVLLAEQALVPGDVIDFHDEIMRVDRIGFRTTTMTTTFGRTMIIPNYLLAQDAVQNLTQRESASTSKFALEVSVDYGSDLTRTQQVLTESLQLVGEGILVDECLVLLRSFEDFGVRFSIVVATTRPLALPVLRSKVLFSAWNALKAEGISIPFPQLDIHFDKGMPS